MGLTLARKIWDSHTVSDAGGDDEDLLYVDLHLLHEVNTPQAFDDLRRSGRGVRRPDLTVGTEDHNTPTVSLDKIVQDPAGRRQLTLMRSNCDEFEIPLLRLGDAGQGIVHVIAPELGLVRPGMTIACCDSHTTTLGAFGTLAFGIGTAQVEHVLATQTLRMRRTRDMSVTITGQLPLGVTAKDVVLALIAEIGTAGGQGYAIEFRGDTIDAMSMEARMTICNMGIEAGTRTGLIGPDDTTFDYLHSLPGMPQRSEWAAQTQRWKALRTDPDAIFDKEVFLDVTHLTPYVSWGTNPGQSIPLGGTVPDPREMADIEQRTAAERALTYMGLTPGTKMRDVPIDAVFLGSCTNGRIEDLRAAATVLQGRRVAEGVNMLIVPGSTQVRAQAVQEGLDRVFAEAGADFRPVAGCSMCAALNEDRLPPGSRAASTSNRNFEGRQGKGSRTHLVSPEVAAATAVAGTLSAPADL